MKFQIRVARKKDMKSLSGEARESFHEERMQMVEQQLRRRGIHDQHVLAAMEKIPRHVFLPAEFISSAYNDNPVTIGEDQTISQPYMVALMTQCLQVHKGDRVLEIGTGSGYQTAILMEMGAEVYTIERVKPLAEKAEKKLKDLGYDAFHMRIGDGTLGWPEQAPFQGIIVTAAAPEAPETYKEQLLEEGGKLIIPVGSRYSQVLHRITRVQDRFNKEEFTPCVFVPLVGKYGWKEEY
jgi:protein-L-isoaspartate(D-aspartate) O-methyltransferase